MNSAIERLLTLRVEDVMSTGLVTVFENSTMREAAEILASREVTGLPVVDVAGRCVGIVSASDFVAKEIRRAPSGDLLPGDNYALNLVEGGGPWQIESIAENRVGDYMSPLVQTIRAKSPIMNAARLMCREHIHRLVIVDDDQRPVGIISSLDLIAAVVAAVEE